MQSRSPRRRTAITKPFLLSGIAYCIDCGNSMIGITKRQMWKRKNGERIRGVYRYYQCQTRTNQSLCNYNTWKAATLEEKVRQDLNTHILNLSTLITKNKGVEEIMPTGPNTNLHKRKFTRYMKYLKEAANGAITLEKLRFLLRELHGENEATEGMNGIHDLKESLVSSKWNEFNHQTKSRFLKVWIDQIKVGEKEANIVLKS